jgi:hypothetical protein
MIYVDLATDPRAAQLRSNLAPLIEAMLELLEQPDKPPLETIYADRKDYRQRDTEESLKSSERARATTVQIKRQLIQSIATDGYQENWDPLRVAIRASNEQFNLITGGGHRTASLLALGLPVPAVLVDPSKNFEP